jgi:hypothetical protein
MAAQSLSIGLLAGMSADALQSDIETPASIDACAPNTPALTGALAIANAMTTLRMVRVRTIGVSLQSQGVYRSSSNGQVRFQSKLARSSGFTGLPGTVCLAIKQPNWLFASGLIGDFGQWNRRFD